MKLESLIQKISGGTAQFFRNQIPVLPPVLGPAVRFPYGAFQLKARITKGAQYEIQATTDLQHWHTITTDTADSEIIEYVDSDASKFSYRFYRIIAGVVQSANVM